MSKENRVSLLDDPLIRGFVFHPRPDPGTDLPSQAEEIWSGLRDDARINTRTYPADPDGPHILFFHGNGEIASDYDPIGPIYKSFGITFLVSDYRGYGKSTGRPTAVDMLWDAHAVWNDVRVWMDERKRTGPLWVMGRSLGSAPALELCSGAEGSPRGVVIESGFAYTMDLLCRIGLDIRKIRSNPEADRVNLDKIAGYKGPTLIIHGEADDIIPVSHARALHQASPASRKKLSIISGADHNSLIPVAGETYFHMIREFIDESMETART